jgi:c-di-AMP phosphodiesterase-like protein
MLPIILIILLILYRNKVIKYIKKNLRNVIIVLIQIIIIIFLLKNKRENLENIEIEQPQIETEQPQIETEQPQKETEQPKKEEIIEIDDNEKINTGDVILEKKVEEDIIEDPKKSEHEVKLPGEEIIAIQPIKTENVLNRQLSQISENKYNILPTNQWVTPNAKDIFKQKPCMCPQVSTFNEYYSIIE